MALPIHSIKVAQRRKTELLYFLCEHARSKSSGASLLKAFLSKTGERSFFWLTAQADQTLFVIYIRDSIALRFQPFMRMYENCSKIALNSTCSKGLNNRSLP